MEREMMRVEVVRTIHFEKNVKGLLKRYRSLESDLDVLISVIEKYPEGKFPVSFRLQGYPGCYFVKVKKIRSNSFPQKGVNSGFRLIYCWKEKAGQIQLIELYHKKDKELEDSVLLKKFCYEIG
jgi:mRNA-degrading endonuclease RelE of RelBE toxin-antitoxin system